MNNLKHSRTARLKAAVYQKTPKPLLPSKPKVLTALILIQLMMLSIFPIMRTYRISWVLFGASIPIAGWLFMSCLLYTSPSPRD